MGLKNSNLIAAIDSSAGNASVAARAYNGGGKNDWYLPTIGELAMLCQFAHGQKVIPGFPCVYETALNTGVPAAFTFNASPYQSSSQSGNPGSAQWHENFVSAADGNGAQQSTWGYAPSTFSVRPIRAFANTTASLTAGAISGVTAPRTSDTPVIKITAGAHYTGDISWSGSPTTFDGATTYTATITLNPEAGYSFRGVTANSFTVAGATSVTNDAGSGIITAIFPATLGSPSKVAVTRAYSAPTSIHYATSDHNSR